MKAVRTFLLMPASRSRAELRSWLKPARPQISLGLAHDLMASRIELMVENAMLRKQLEVVMRTSGRKRVRLRRWDRILFLLLARLTRRWRNTLRVVQPETLLRWHREAHRLIWRHKSKPKGRPGRPPVAEATIIRIQEMAVANRLWGAERIRGELKKIGIVVAKATVQKYMDRARKNVPGGRGGQGWSTFLRNHGSDIWACDFVETFDVLFRPIYLFVVMELGRREVVGFGVTRNPTSLWIAGVVKEVFDRRGQPKFFLRDNDKKFGSELGEMLTAAGVRTLKTPLGAPKANGHCERLIGTLRREFLDHVLVLSDEHLTRLTSEYVEYFNGARPHQALEQETPLPSGTPATGEGEVIALPVLSGLHHDYRRAA